MTRLVFSFQDPSRLIIGTVGMPGEREFYLQVKDSHQIRSFALEKSQAAALAERCNEILREIGVLVSQVPLDLEPLETPIESEFPIGVMSLLWEAERSRFLLEAQSAINPSGEEPAEDLVSDDDTSAPPIVRISFTPEMARAFIRRTEEVVAAGRQPCMFCGGPIDLNGHLCPRANGYRRRD
ncbi:MAG: DUF3090 family protein [Actinobacteria bacterium]|nr:DUF3090 family protein [Actinomycetota bacterium]